LLCEKRAWLRTASACCGMQFVAVAASGGAKSCCCCCVAVWAPCTCCCLTSTGGPPAADWTAASAEGEVVVPAAGSTAQALSTLPQDQLQPTCCQCAALMEGNLLAAARQAVVCPRAGTWCPGMPAQQQQRLGGLLQG
jgi:hypothetical protein